VGTYDKESPGSMLGTSLMKRRRGGGNAPAAGKALQGREEGSKDRAQLSLYMQEKKSKPYISNLRLRKGSSLKLQLLPPPASEGEEKNQNQKSCLWNPST